MAPDKKDPKKGKGGASGNLYWIYGIIFLFIMVALFVLPDRNSGKEIPENRFWELVEQNEVDYIEIINQKQVEVFRKEGSTDSEGPETGTSRFGSNRTAAFHFKIIAPETFVKELREKGVLYRNVERADFIGPILQFLIPVFIIIAIWIFLMRRMSGGMGGSQIFNIGKSKASLFDKENRVKVTFDDVAGQDEAKEEVQEVVEFLKNPSKFTKLGGHIPKGVLLVGPPGTGKTLLAKAVAGEAAVPFFSLSGSDFVEMFVGVGAARVRDLFKQAKEKAPCIIFIDEIDAIGRSRGRANMTGGNDERENTLNQILVEMDGFNTDQGVILMAATNRPDVLDKALLRPGRFDRMIAVDRPDLKEREAIFKVHLKKLVKSENVNPKILATQTPGFVGADIMNVCNEAALIAARKSKEAIDMQDFQDAIDRVIGGLEKKNRIISPSEKKIIAYHEAGHAVAGWFLEHADPLVKVSIIPRGIAALGYAQYLPREEYLYDTDQLIDRMCVTLAGRAAEEIIFGKISTGAQNDLERITQMAYSMITIYGMNPRVGNISYTQGKEEMSFTKPYSESLAQTIDEEARAMIARAYERTKQLLLDKLDYLEILAQELLKTEVIFQADLDRLLGPRPFARPDESPDVTNSDSPDDTDSPDADAPHNGSADHEQASTPPPAPTDTPPAETVGTPETPKNPAPPKDDKPTN